MNKRLNRKKINKFNIINKFNHYLSKKKTSFLTIACSLILIILITLPVFTTALPAFQQQTSKDSLHNNPNEKTSTYEWAVTYGGGNIDVGHYVEQTNDGGYIITGYTRSYGSTSGRNIWLIKTDASGNELWNQTYGGSNDEEGFCVQQTTDGGYIITGYTKSFGAQMEDVIVIKTDSQGNQQWIKTYGGAHNDGGRSVRQTSDGGYIIAGYTSSFGAGSVDAYLIKTDASGNIEWTKTHGGSSTDGAYCISLTSDGGFILTGWTMSYGPGYLLNAWLVKTDHMGNLQWHQAFGGTGVDKAYSVVQSFDGGYVIAGETDSFGAGLYDMLLIKTDSNGNQQWMKTFGGPQRDYAYSVAQTFEGNYILTGYTRSYGAGGDDIWVVKTDASGNELWNQTYGGTSSDVGYCIKQTDDGGYIVVGHTLSYGAGLHDVWLIKLESDETPDPPLLVDAGGPYEGIVGIPIEFSGSVEGGTPPYTFTWYFGDGNTSNDQSPHHIYTEPGMYEAEFSVTDSLGKQASDTAIVTILLDDTIPPILTVIKPLRKSAYLFNNRIFDFPITLIIGSLDVTAEAIDEQSGIQYLSLSLNGEEKLNTTESSFIWKWDERSFGRHILSFTAVDNAGNSVTEEISVFKIL